MIDHVKNVRKRKRHTQHAILPLAGEDLKKFREYCPYSTHDHVVVCYYDRKVVVIPCDPDGKSDWDGAGLFETDWSETGYNKAVQEVTAGTLISW